MFTIQEFIFILNKFWNKYGCTILNSYDIEMGAGTSSVFTFLNSLKMKNWKAAYIQKSRRPEDGRYGRNSLKLQQHHQYQVVLKPSPINIIDLYLKSIKKLKINFKKNDIFFISDNWKNKTLSSWGTGWEVILNGIEVAQITFFQNIGGIYCENIIGEITYGIERLALNLQKTNNIYKLIWNKNKVKKIYYKNLFRQNEIEQSKLNFEYINIKMLLMIFKKYKIEIIRLLKLNLIIPSYELILKLMHIFNLIYSNGYISYLEKNNYVNDIKNLSCILYKKYLKN